MAPRGSKREREAAAAAREIDLEVLEREHVEQLARAHAALADAQDRSYWLDRWGIDLNAQMRRPGARRLRALMRWTRELKRGKHAIERYAHGRLDDLRATATEDEIAAASARAQNGHVTDPPPDAGAADARS